MGDVAYRKAVDRGLEKVVVEQIVGTAQSSGSGEFDSQLCPLVPHLKQRWLSVAMRCQAGRSLPSVDLVLRVTRMDGRGPSPGLPKTLCFHGSAIKRHRLLYHCCRRCNVADYRDVSHYRVFHYDTGVNAGKTDIIVMAEGDTTYRYEKLSPERAHHIIDLLRNEDRIVVELESGLLQVPGEPVGEGEAP